MTITIVDTITAAVVVLSISIACFAWFDNEHLVHVI
jgi:hypothetical protein